VDANRTGWWLSLYPDAAEAGGSFRYSTPPKPRLPGNRGDVDHDRAAQEAARRARANVRRYCAANRLNRLGTLTYRGSGCHDPAQLRQDVAGFFRDLRDGLGGDGLPYLWAAEWHKTGHGQHVHFAVGRYAPRRVIERSWGRGFVHIKLLGDLPVGSTRLDCPSTSGRPSMTTACLGFIATRSRRDSSRLAPGCMAVPKRRPWPPPAR
jgi:hypothetical protein